jgi:hypothetical protein
MQSLAQLSWPIWTQARGSRFRYALRQLIVQSHYAIWTTTPTQQPQGLDLSQIQDQDHDLEVAIQYGTKYPVVQAVDHIRLGHHENQPYWHLVLGTKL